MHALRHEDHPQNTQGAEREGIVVWDQKGLVVLWPDGHCSRFPWAALRQACPCTECCEHREGQESIHESTELAGATG